MNLSQLIKLKNKNLILQNVDGTNLGLINAKDIMLSLRFNSISELSFTVDRENCEMYDLLVSTRIILVQDVGRFIIFNPSNSENGAEESKTITCKSYEYDINRKTVPYLKGTYKFYSILPEEETIMSKIMSYLPNWTISNIDVNLYNIYRTFDLENVPLLQLIMEQVSPIYEAVFSFDTINSTISVTSYENVIKSSDIYLSFENLVKTLEITEKTDELITAVSVFGGNNLSINLVNPLGDTIYDFSYFTDTVVNGTKFMSDSLISAVNNWESVVESYQTSYASYLTQRKTKIAERVVLETELVALKGELKSLVLVRDALLESGQSATTANSNVISKQNEINLKETAIATKQAEIDVVETNITNIQNAVSITSNFTADQIKELDRFIHHQSVTDENFVAGENDTDDIVQQTAQDLYNKYKKLLAKNKDLKYEFAIELEDFIPHSQYQLFTSQLDWGVEVTLKNSRGGLSYPILLGLDIPLDNEGANTQFLFSTDMRLRNANEEYNDYLANTISNTVSKVVGSSLSWGSYVNSGDKDKVSNLFTNGLNLDNQEVKSATGQEIIFDSTGLLGRKSENGTYSDFQWKFVNNKLLFTSDNWSTCSLALGLITLPDGSQNFGINTSVLMGNLIAGNQLVIKNADNSFVIDSSGVTINDAVMQFIGNNGKNRIILNPTEGFKIQKLVGSTWTDVVYLDSEGNAIFSGDITGSTISGSTFNAGDGNLVIDINGNITSIGDVSFGNNKLTFNKTTGLLTVKGDIEADDLFLTIDGVKTSIIDELTGKIDGQYITGGMSGTTALGNLLVDNLSTSDKIRNYLASDTSQVNYIRIYDQYIEFVEATYSGGTTQARTGDKTGDLLYWTDDTYNFVTIVTDGTLEPVMVYNYTELIKGKYGFKLIDGTNIPSIELGAGSGGINDAGKTFIYKGIDGFYIDYRHSVTGESTIFKITDDGIDLSMFPTVTYPEDVVLNGISQIWVQPDIPTQAKVKDVWVDTDDYSRYDKTDLTSSTTLLESDNEVIKATGTITITLHSATTAGIIKKIYNVGTGIVTIAGSINGKTNMLLYPNESVELITDGSQWRY